MAEVKKNNIINKLTLNQQRERDAELVTGRFSFDECHGGTMNFGFKKYKGDPVVLYSLTDGQIEKVPRAVAKHLATSGKYRVNKRITDRNGNSTYNISTIIRRYNFESLEFFSDDDIKPDLSIVEKI